MSTGSIKPSEAAACPASVEEVIATYLDAVDAGRASDRGELLAQHPQFATELAAFFADDDRLSQLAEPFHPAAAPVADNVSPFGGPPKLPRTPPEDWTDNSIGTRFGDYDLLEEIARGGMGLVYKARQLSLNRIVALKMILAGQFASPDDVQRFRAEAQAAAQLQHPNIVAIYEVGEHAGQHFFSMDYVDGPSLAAVVRENPLTARHAAEIVRVVAEAVHHAHARGVIHRDLKPSNILLQGSGFMVQGSGEEKKRLATANPTTSALNSEPRTLNPKVTDFGLARRIEHGSDLTGTGQILGTPSYMPPEQAAARHGEIGPASDVYSLGAILYESLTGRPPFRAESPLDTLVQVLEAEPVSPRLLNRSVPRDLETICLKCLEKQPRRRYATAAELGDDLGRFLNDEPIRARPVGPLGRFWRWSKRRPGWAAVIGVTFLALTILSITSTLFTRELSRELDRTARAKQELQIALARQVAERLDSDLRQLAAVPRGLAVFLAERSDWTETQMDATLRELLDSDPRLFGMCVAFQPFQFDPEHEHFARYICRRPGSPDGVELNYLHPPSYLSYRKRDWFRLPMCDGESHWSEPYIDNPARGDAAPIVTYSVPFQRDGRFCGVVTADLSLAYLRQLKTWLDELKLARGDYGFVISPAGTFISDANSEYQMGRRIAEFARPEFDPGFTALFDLIQRHEAGSVRGIDFWSEAPATFFVAPVASSGWSFVAVVPEQSSILRGTKP